MLQLSRIFGKRGLVTIKSFFDYSASEKKEIIKKAAKESNRLQLELVKEYESQYVLNKS